MACFIGTKEHFWHAPILTAPPILHIKEGAPHHDLPRERAVCDSQWGGMSVIPLPSRFE